MSEKIKITIVTEDEKPNAEKKGIHADPVLLTQDSTMTLMPVLLKNHLMNGSFCGGRGDCGRCVVQFLKGAPLPTGIERARLTPEELRQGYRLACVTRPRTDCTVRIVDGKDARTPIVTEVNLPSQYIDLNSQNKDLSQNQKPDAMKFTNEQMEDLEKAKKKASAILKEETHVTEKSRRYIIAVDLGTTTIAMQLRDAVTGETVDTYCEVNPQRCYGTDVLARIEASCNGNREELQKLVCESLERGLRQFMAYLPQILCMCVAGNTTMEHLLMGYDARSLGRTPFVPVETGLQQVSVSRLFSGATAAGEKTDGQCTEEISDFPVFLAPCISAFVGGDIVAGLYALHMFPDLTQGEGEPNGGQRAAAGPVRKENSQVTLLIDLGTNGEMAITDGRRMIVTATAAGPAFEGNGDIIGTDRIALTAELLRRGVLDETGLLAEPYFEEGVFVGTAKKTEATGNTKENGCYFTQKDIRNMQMAKAAVRAGVEILWEEMGRPGIDRIYLAGGFGYYLDVEAAIAVGLLPAYMRGRVRAVGNTSLAGAYELGRDLCGGKTEKEMLEKKLFDVESINLAGKENFEKLYVKYMNLEEN